MKLQKWSQTPFFYITILIAFSLFTYFFKVNMPLTDGDTAFYGHIAYNMVRTGDWQSLHFMDVDYNNPEEKEAAQKIIDVDKPPLSIWPMAVSYKLFGFNDFATKAWHALLAVISIFLCYLISRELSSPRASFWAGAVLLTMVMIFYCGQVPQQDIPMIFCIMLSLWGLIRFCKGNGVGNYYLFWLGMGLGMLTRGLPAIFYFLGPALLFWILRQYMGVLNKPLFPNKSRAVLHSIVGILVFLISGGTWFLLEYLQRGQAFIDFTVNTGLLRFAKTPSTTGPEASFLAEIPLLLAAMIPWTGFIWHALKSGWQRRKESDGGFFLLLLWFIVAFGLAMVSKWRFIRYLLPCLPPLAILIGIIIDKAWEKAIDDEGKRAFRAAVIVNLMMAILFSAIIYYIYYVLANQAGMEDINRFLPVIVLFLVVFNLAMIAFSGFGFAKKYRIGVVSLALLSFISYMILLNGLHRHIDLVNPWPKLVSKVTAIRQPDEKVVYLPKEGMPFLVYYLKEHPLRVADFAGLNAEISGGRLQGAKRFYLFTDTRFTDQEIQSQIKPVVAVKLLDAAAFGQSAWQISFN